MSRHQFERLTTSISKLLLDTSNPRIRVAQTQEQCLMKLLTKREHMIALMKSIANDGLSTQPILVTRDAEGKFVVKDGNRRIASLKLLNAPDRCPNPSMQPVIRKIRDAAEVAVPKKIEVLCSDDPQVIAREIVHRHQGENGGAGQVTWNAYLKTIFWLNNDPRHAEYKRTGQYLLWAEQQGIEIDDEFPISTLHRFFNDENLKLLGVRVRSEKVDCLEPEAAVIEMARLAVSDFGSKQINVQNVFTPDKAKEFISSIRARVLPGQSKAPEDARDVGQPNGNATNPGADGDSAKPAPTSSNGAKPTRPPAKPVFDRAKLFNKANPVPVIPKTERKANQLLFEIQNIKDVRLLPVMLAFFIRAFLEASVSHYGPKSGNGLHEQMASIADTMKSKGELDDSAVALVKSHAAGHKQDESVLHIDYLQKCLHRKTHLPKATDLITVWDNLGPFVHACWKHKR